MVSHKLTLGSPDTNSQQMTQGGAERIEPFLIYRNL